MNSDVTSGPERGPHGPQVDSRWTSASTPSAARALTLYGLAALIGLGIAGYELLTAQGTETRSVPPEDVAVINLQPILRSDFLTQTESETGLPFESTTREQRLQVLDEMVQEELKVQRGLELNFAETDQNTRNALSNVVDQQMVASIATDQATDRALLEYYQRYQTQYRSPGQMTVCDLVLIARPGDTTSLQRGASAVAALRAATPLPLVVQRYQLANRNNCEDNFYFAIKIHLGDALFSVAEKLANGGVSDPLSVSGEIHILQMVNNIAPAQESFAEARAQVASDYRNDAEARVRDGTMDFLRRRSRILVASDYRDYRPRPPSKPASKSF